jgi:hypothetical protein
VAVCSFPHEFFILGICFLICCASDPLDICLFRVHLAVCRSTLETRAADGDFPAYRANDIHVRVRLIDAHNASELEALVLYGPEAHCSRAAGTGIGTGTTNGTATSSEASTVDSSSSSPSSSSSSFALLSIDRDATLSELKARAAVHFRDELRALSAVAAADDAVSTGTSSATGTGSGAGSASGTTAVVEDGSDEGISERLCLIRMFDTKISVLGGDTTSVSSSSSSGGRGSLQSPKASHAASTSSPSPSSPLSPSSSSSSSSSSSLSAAAAASAPLTLHELGLSTGTVLILELLSSAPPLSSALSSSSAAVDPSAATMDSNTDASEESSSSTAATGTSTDSASATATAPATGLRSRLVAAFESARCQLSLGFNTPPPLTAATDLAASLAPEFTNQVYTIALVREESRIRTQQ